MNWCRIALMSMAALACASVLPAKAQLAGQTVRGFHLPEYDAAGQMTQQLFGETATFMEGGIIKLTALKIEIFREGKVSARVFSPECAYDPTRKRAASKDHIRIVTEKGVITGDGFAWNGENQQFQIFQNARVTLDGQADSTLLVPGAGVEEDDSQIE